MTAVIQKTQVDEVRPDSVRQGVVLCNQPRVLDLQSRGASFVEKVPPVIIDEVIARLQALLE